MRAAFVRPCVGRAASDSFVPMRALGACVLLALAAVGCGKPETPACAPGTSLFGGSPPRYAAAWCARRDGTRDGPIVGFFPSGARRFEGTLAAGAWRSLTVFDRSGKTLGSVSLADGTGTWRMWHDNGRVSEEGRLEGGKRTGTWTKRYESGQRALEGSYQAGAPDGLFRWWTPSGVLTSEVPFKAGRVHGTAKTYDEQGALIEEADYEAGTRTALRRCEGGTCLPSP